MAVVVLGPWKWPQPMLVHMPPELVRQREQINTRAAAPPRLDPGAEQRRG